MKIALIGANGQLGSDLLKKLNKDNTSILNYPDFDITRPESVNEILSKINPAVVINTASFNCVDECELHPKNALELNTVAVKTLSQVCADIEATLVHFSTDYVFDGRAGKPYTEKDMPNPQCLWEN